MSLRRDKLNGKGMEVNKCLISLWHSYNCYFVDHSDVNKETHLNTSGLYLNYNGRYVVGGNMVNAIIIWLNTFSTYMCNPDKLNTSYTKVSSNIINDTDITIVPSTRPKADILEEDMLPDIILKDLKAKIKINF